MKHTNYLEITLKILGDKLNVAKELLTEESYTMQLTGAPFWLNHITMAYLFFELEKQTGIRIDTQHILKGEFNSISGIVKVIENHAE